MAPGRPFAPCLALLAAAALAAGCARTPAVGVQPGEPLSPRAFAALEGVGEVVIPAGAPLVVNVWATWCEPCRREMQSLEKLHRRGIRVVGISVDTDRRLAAEFVRAQKLSFPNAIDLERALAHGELAITKFPTTLVIDASGVVRWREEAARDWSDEATATRLAAVLEMRP